MRKAIFPALCLLASAAAQTPPAAYRLLKSESGPSGRVVSGTAFVLDEQRSRFVFPSDKSFVVSCEFEGPPGRHAITAIWKDPNGRPAFLSEDIRLETQGPRFSAYWTYRVAADMASGLWHVEFRINGQPAGSHVFQLEVPPPALVTAPEPPAERRVPAIDEVYKTAGAALVWVRKLDGSGKRIDLGTGFVLAPGVVATAFQTIDASNRLELEFADGRKTLSDKLLQWNRLQDWALIQADTAGVKPLARGDLSKVAVGQRLIVFNVEAGEARAIGGVDVSGTKSIAGHGDRLIIQPSPTPQAVGGPVLDRYGDVVGVLGGSLAPGARAVQRNLSLSSTLFQKLFAGGIAVTPVSALPVSPDASAGTALFTLTANRVLTPALDDPSPDFLYGGTTAALPKEADQPNDVSEFSRRDPNLVVYTTWTRKGKQKEHLLAATIYDASNRIRVTLPPGKVKLVEHLPTRHAFSILPGTLTPDIYRVDLILDDRIVWRTYFQILE